MNLIKYLKKNIIVDLLFFGVFLVISLFYTGFYEHNIFKTMFNPSGDPYYYLFFLKWWLWAIIHHKNPFVTNYLTYPRIYNTAWLTSIPVLSVLVSPLTYCFGVIFSWNILCLMAPVTAAFSAYLLFRYLKLSHFASFIGGYIFGFSTYEMAEIFGHVFLIYIFPIPLIILLLLMRFDKKIGKALFFICVSILMALLLGISIEITTTFITFLGLSIIIFIIYNLRNENVLKRVYSLTKDIIFAGIIALLLSSPFVYYLIVGLKNIHGPINSPTYYSADILNYIIPTPITRFGKTIFSNIASHFTGNYSEEGAYIGIGLFLITIFSMHERLKKQEDWVKPLITITAMLAIFSLGFYLHINGVITKLPLLWHLFDFKPLNNALPVRFMMYVFLCVAFWTAVWLDNNKTNKLYNIKRLLFVVFSVILIIPNYSMYNWSKPNFNRRAFKYIPKDVNILSLPINPYGQGALWVAGSNFKFHITGPQWGYNDYKHSWPVMNMFYGNNISIGYKEQIEYFCVKHDILYVVIPLNQKSIWERVFNKIGWQHISKDGVIIYKVPEELFKYYKNISYIKSVQIFYLKNFNKMFNSSNHFLRNKKNLLTNLYPKYLEIHGYLPKIYGFEHGHANNWTQNGGWIGQWSCPGGQGSCFGVGILGNINILKPIIEKFKSQSLQIFFPYPKLYNKNIRKGSGQLLIIFKRKIVNVKNNS